MRVDVIVAFFVRVKPTIEGVATAAQTLGSRTLNVEALSELTEDKFVDALRSTAATMTMQELQDQRERFVQGVQGTVSEDLTKNGLELERVSHEFNQTAKEHLTRRTRSTRKAGEAHAVKPSAGAGNATRSSRTPRSRCARRTATRWRASSKSRSRKPS